MKGNPIHKRFQQAILSVLLPAFALSGGPVQANPQGGVVVRGAADIRAISANQMRIHQQTPMAVINWQDFSIGAGQTTRFVQPSNGTVLNRVTSGNVSQIHGQLKANANVYVVNANGIVVGASGVVDVGGRVVMSTLDIDNDDFMAGGADRFYGDSTKGVTNFGTISSSGGDVVLMGGFVDNQGQIGALNGTVAIGSGGDILLQEGAGAKISVRGSSDYDGTGINNTGTIRGASAELKAHGNVYALAINNGGAIRATGADRSSGRVLLRASGGSSNINLGNRSTVVATAGTDGGTVQIDAGQGRVEMAGSVDARGTRAGGSVSVVGNQILQTPDSVVDATGGVVGGSVNMDAVGAIAVMGTVRSEAASGKGGEVTVTGRTVLIDDTAHLSVNGHTAGGRIRAGGDFQGRDTGLREADSMRVNQGALLTADSVAGLAGTVIVWANHDTMFLGEVSASALGSTGNGGLVEISGKETLYYDGVARVGSVNGRVGTLLFDPGDVTIGASGGAPPLTSPVTGSLISMGAINSTLQGGANVLVVTEDGHVLVQDLGGGGDQNEPTGDFRDSSIQWSNSRSSFGIFAGRNIFVNNHIRTSGAGSINLLAGWSGKESDAYLALDPQSAWDYYVGKGLFGDQGGSVVVGFSNMNRHIVVGSRYGDTNVAGANVIVRGADTNSVLRWSQIGFHDNGQVFAPRLNRGNGIVLDLTDSAGNWYLSDGINGAAATPLDKPVAGIGDPVVAIAGNAYGQEVDMNGDGIVDGVRGINSKGVLHDTFIPYASHFNSASGGNWWWQQIDAAAPDPEGFGGRRPEYGAGTAAKGATINVLATGSVTLQGGTASSEIVGAHIGHGGPNRVTWGYSAISGRDVANEDPANAAFSRSGVERNQVERNWSFNGSNADRNSNSIARLAPVYGNINVLAGVLPTQGVTIDRTAGTVRATVGSAGSIMLRGSQNMNASSNSMVSIGHGGIGQFGEYYGNIYVEAGGSISMEAGGATRNAAVIGHHTGGHAYWNPTSVADQQLRFFASVADFDNPNLRRGELFSGAVTTGLDPARDPAINRRYTLADYSIVLNNGLDGNPGTGDDFYEVVVNPGNTGNFIPIINPATGAIITSAAAPRGQYQNIHTPSTIININPLHYTRGTSGASAHAQGTNSLAPLYLSKPKDPVTGHIIEALDGSVVNGFHGNITVKAGGSITLAGYNTSNHNGIAARDSRYAAIGHGGRGFELGTEGSGYQGFLLATPSLPDANATNPNALEYVTFRFTAGNELLNTGSRSHISSVGSEVNRAGVFTSITGDIDVTAGGHLTMTAGNDQHDYVRVGHGGVAIADYETSSFILGDIRVRVGGDILVRGGGAVQPMNRGSTTDAGQRNYALTAPAYIGHGGYRHGFFALMGDIDVEAGGNIHIQGGAFRRSEGKIGHDTVEGRAQVGGDFTRVEHFRHDGVENYIYTTLSADSARVEYTPYATTGPVHPDSLNRVLDFTSNGAGTLVGAARNTADIRVVAGGGVRLDHLAIGERQPVQRLIMLMGENYTSHASYNGNFNILENQDQGVQTYQSSSQIGHGGNATLAFRVDNPAANYQDKIGHITVIANGGDVVLENSTGEQRWTRIGHGVGAGEQIDDGVSWGYSRALELAGNVHVAASRDILLNAAAAAENDRVENWSTVFGAPVPSRLNPVAIGHGGVYNNRDLVVLGRGELINGIAASSNVSAIAGRDLTLLGGLGVEASYAQLGHGFASDIGDDRTYRMGVATGFAGNITAISGRNTYLEAGPNAWSEQPSASTDNEGRSVTGAFAAIGHGGYQLDAPSYGNINIYSGGDLSVIAQRRTDLSTDVVGQSPYSVLNPAPGLGTVASLFNFAKIGHFSVENGGRHVDTNGVPTRSDEVTESSQTGDIVVVVGRDLALKGGTTPDVDQQTIYGAFAQIGHGGPSINGDLKGNITVLVKRDVNVKGGAEVGDAGTILTEHPLNNYAMIGHGDRLYGTSGAAAAIFNDAAGFRDGHIVLASGRHTTIDRALVGHVDPRVGTSNQPYFGNTQVAVSRLNPFFGGEGTLTAKNSAVFSSGTAGYGSRLEFYIPSRSNNKMDDTTRLNERTLTFTEAPDDFAAPFNKDNGYLAGRADEVYLTPDLWWDQSGRAASELGILGGGVFPTDALSGMGGAIALVESPGGVYSLSSLTAGALGSSSPVYRDRNGVSGLGSYTLYYDAIQPVRNAPPTPPRQPEAPSILIPGNLYDRDFNFEGLFFGETYDAFFREDEVGSGLYPMFGFFDGYDGYGEYSEEGATSAAENALDNLFGSSSSDEEDEEEARRRRARERKHAGQAGATYYIYEPETNRYSSYRVFGDPFGPLDPVN